MGETIMAKTKDGYKVIIPLSFKGYKLIKVLGSGSSSVVCLVENQFSKKLYSAKIIPKKYIKENNLAEQIENEISIMKKIDHRNIVKFQETFEFKNQYNQINKVIIMEYCENGDLCSYILKHGFESDSQKMKITLGFLNGIKYLHDNNISHGDIKLENILLDSEFNAKLADFGFSKIGLTAGDDGKNGTLYYAAPELFFTGNFNPMKSDIWSVGITLYCLSEQSFPFEQNNERSIVKQITSQNLSINAGLNKKLKGIVEKCFIKNPSNRPNIEDILNDDYFSLIKN